MTDTASTAETRLPDREQLRELKARYCRYADTKQWAALRRLMTDDATFAGFGSAPDGCTPDEFVAGVARRLSTAVSVHHCTMPEFTFTGPDEATGTWAMTDRLEWPEGFRPSEAPDARGFIGYGHYVERYRRDESGWRFARIELSRLSVVPLTGQERT